MLRALAAVAVEELAHRCGGRLNTPAVAVMCVALCGARRLVVGSVALAVPFLALAPLNVSQLRITEYVPIAGRHAIVAALGQHHCHGFMRRLDLACPIDVEDAGALLNATNGLLHLRSLRCSGPGTNALLDVVGCRLLRFALPACRGDWQPEIDWVQLRLLRRVGPLLTQPDAITSIDLSALRHLVRVDDGFGAQCDGLVVVCLPPTVTTIGHNFLYGCRGLAAVLDLRPLGALRSIGNAFAEGSTLPELRLPPSVTSIGKAFVSRCARMRSVLDLSHLTTLRAIDDFFARGCAAVDVRLPPNVSTIGNHFLGGCTSVGAALDLSHMTQLHTIGDNFADSIPVVVLPPSITCIGDSYCIACDVPPVLDLTGLPRLQRIGASFARGTAVREVRLPSSVTAIGPSFLNGCESLAVALDLSPLTQLTRVDAFFAYGSSLPRLRLPATVTVIGPHFLGRCKSLVFALDLSLLTQLTSIDGSFGFRSSLPELRLPPSVTAVGDNFLGECTMFAAVLDLAGLPLLQDIGCAFASGSAVLDVRLPPNGARRIGRNFLHDCHNISEDRRDALRGRQDEVFGFLS
jgi:hypothetical protein